LTELAQEGDLARLQAHVQLMLAQIEVNKEQAKHKSIFVAGARPAVIWVCCLALLFTGLIHPLLTWVWAFAEFPGKPPETIETGHMSSLLVGLLGLGAMRSYDKKQGTQTDSIRGGN
jgi:hypothetical protein